MVSERDDKVGGLRLTEGLFLQCQKDCVQEFDIFDIVVDHIVEFHALFASKQAAEHGGGRTHLCPSRVVAHGIKGTVLPPYRQDLFEHEDEEEQAPRSQIYIMYLEQEVELLGLTCLHDFADPENSDQVANQRADNDGLGGERRGAANIMCEVVGKLGERDILKNKIGDGSHDG